MEEITCSIYFQKSKGKYIALCEGDDYWTDEFKLEKQAKLFDEDSELSLCFHNVSCINEMADTKRPYLNWNSNRFD